MYLPALLLLAIISAMASIPPDSSPIGKVETQHPQNQKRERIFSHISLTHVVLLPSVFSLRQRHKNGKISSEPKASDGHQVDEHVDVERLKHSFHRHTHSVQEHHYVAVASTQKTNTSTYRKQRLQNRIHGNHHRKQLRISRKAKGYGHDDQEVPMIRQFRYNQSQYLHKHGTKRSHDQSQFPRQSDVHREGDRELDSISHDHRRVPIQNQEGKKYPPQTNESELNSYPQPPGKAEEPQYRYATHEKSLSEEEEMQLQEDLRQHDKEKHQQVEDQLSEQLLKQMRGTRHDGFQSFPFQRRPPHISRNPLSNSHLFTDQTEYIRLGDDVGSVLAIGDFTADRYADLLVVLNTHRLRCVAVLVWDHHSYSFQRASTPDLKSSSFSSPFCIDSVPSIPSNAVIASASTFDANADGLLDVLLIVHRSKTKHLGCVLLGDGTGKLAFDQIIPDVNPYSLIMDANDDMRSDIFFINPKGERIFYINDPPGSFTRYVWEPYALMNSSSSSENCQATYPFNSNSFVDINGDCLPDLIVTTNCGMEVWLNQAANLTTFNLKLWQNGHFSGKPVRNFHNLQLPQHQDSFITLNKAVWDFDKDDSHAAFFDFNSDGAIDIAVINSRLRNIRISYNVRRARVDRKLCTRDEPLQFLTQTALSDVEISALNFGPTLIPPMLHVGDFNYDGLADLLFVDRDSGTLSLYTARLMQESHSNWLDRSKRRIHASQPQRSPLSSLVQRLVFAFTGETDESSRYTADMVTYQRCAECSELQNVEDPLAATFFDVDESGRQDILISQQRGTRLIWNNYEHTDDLVYFKATGVNSANPSANPSNSWIIHPQPPQIPSSSIHAGPSTSSYSQPFSPLPGNTFKISYGGRYRRETQTCTQCPQSSLLTLQSCSCLFGITRIANYIEEMAMGGAGGVRSWMALMPNALAIIWPQHPSPQGSFVKWRVSYLSKGRDGQLKRIVYVLCVTLAILFIAIVYMHNAERCENRAARNSQFGYAYS